MEGKVVPLVILTFMQLSFLNLVGCYNGQSQTAMPLPTLATNPFDCTFNPSEIKEMFEGDVVTVELNCTVTHGSHAPLAVSDVSSVDPAIASVVGQRRFVYRSDQLYRSNDSCFSVQGLFLGRTVLKLNLRPFNNGSELLYSETSTLASLMQDGSADPLYEETSSVEYKVAVIRKERAVDRMFLGLVAVLVVLGSIGIGCKVDLAVVKEVLIHPVAPIIGFCCQYVIMPLTAFGLIKLVGLTGGVALGFFASGCAPGGGSSNMYTLLLGGDVSLSVTLTLISIIASLFMIPLWLFTLGQHIAENDTHIKIPFQNIIISLISVLVPVAIGLLIQKKWVKGARFIVRCLRPFYIILLLVMFTLGVYSNLYIFRLITPTLILCGCLLPYTGFLLSGLIAFLLRQPLPRVLTIAIETGIQNTGLPIILMKFSLPQPEADLSVVAPVVIAMFMPLPLWIAVMIVEIRQRCCRRRLKASLEEAAAIDGTVESNLHESADVKLVGRNNNSETSENASEEKNETDTEMNGIPYATTDPTYATKPL